MINAPALADYPHDPVRDPSVALYCDIVSFVHFNPLIEFKSPLAHVFPQKIEKVLPPLVYERVALRGRPLQVLLDLVSLGPPGVQAVLFDFPQMLN